MIKLGMPILYEYDNIDDNIALAKKLGFDFIENNLNFTYGRRALEDYEALSKKLSDANLFQTLHFYDEADLGGYEEVSDAYLTLLQRYVEYGSKCFLKKVNIHLNKGPVCTISGVKNYIYDKEFKEYSNRLRRSLKIALDICNKYNVELVIENVNHNEVISYLDKIYPILKDEGYKFNYDIGHDYLNSFQLKKLMDKIGLSFNEFHFHDALNKKDHLCLGDGEIDLKYFKDLAIKNDAVVLLEVKSSSDLIKSKQIFDKL